MKKKPIDRIDLDALAAKLAPLVIARIALAGVARSLCAMDRD